MIGGTLMVSRAVKLHGHYQKRLEEMGFTGVSVTAADKDGLNMLISDLKPRNVLISSRFYQCCTPFMMADLHKHFPKINFAAVSLSEYPTELGMYFIVNGAKSYVDYWEGTEEFYKGMEDVRRGKTYISPNVQERFKLRDSYPYPARNLTARLVEVIRLIANGYTGKEAADVLHISERTVDADKRNIYTSLNVRNENELIRYAIYMGIINPEDLYFYGGDFVLNPKPPKEKRKVKKEK